MGYTPYAEGKAHDGFTVQDIKTSVPAALALIDEALTRPTAALRIDALDGLVYDFPLTGPTGRRTVHALMVSLIVMRLAERPPGFVRLDPAPVPPVPRPTAPANQATAEAA